ncbi:hypothetical protein Ppa06_69950 [Planomonospora parontospora subsp. parontospora]|uniref:Uncharacterized protein n=2 Tax=Planomonospora parontospora TaxID=58119 RepID=A0AA37BMN9_9ACTN|nr:hypothetical protein [Planomonospora parontospora]GGK94078.1 hypothetical protein GCM10010126_61830 [Planomonospora parontospora]GII13197.1 hypothetical protein Ppa06_69950 [Planomonospora parontospora subsp. parontospora]
MDVPAPDVPSDPPDRPAPADHARLLARVRAVLADAGFYTTAPEAARAGDVQVRYEADRGVVVTWGSPGTGDAPDTGVVGRFPSVRTVVHLAVTDVLLQAGCPAAYDGDAGEIVVTGAR